MNRCGDQENLVVWNTVWVLSIYQMFVRVTIGLQAFELLLPLITFRFLQSSPKWEHLLVVEIQVKGSMLTMRLRQSPKHTRIGLGRGDNSIQCTWQLHNYHWICYKPLVVYKLLSYTLGCSSQRLATCRSVGWIFTLHEQQLRWLSMNFLFIASCRRTSRSKSFLS